MSFNPQQARDELGRWTTDPSKSKVIAFLKKKGRLNIRSGKGDDYFQETVRPKNHGIKSAIIEVAKKEKKKEVTTQTKKTKEDYLKENEKLAQEIQILMEDFNEKTPEERKKINDRRREIIKTINENKEKADPELLAQQKKEFEELERQANDKQKKELPKHQFERKDYVRDIETSNALPYIKNGQKYSSKFIKEDESNVINKSQRDELNKKYRQNQDTVANNIQEVKSLQKIDDKRADEIIENTKKLLEENKKINQQLQTGRYTDSTKLHKQMEFLRNELLKNSPISEKDAEEWADKLIYPVMSRISPENRSIIGKDLKEAYRIFGWHSHLKVDQIKTTTGGGYVRQETKGINGSKTRILGLQSPNAKQSKSSKEITFHEFGHLVESDSSSLVAASRNLGMLKAGQPLQYYHSFHTNEFGFPYAGTVYSDPDSDKINATETLSVGLEKFSDPKLMVELYQKDPDHFHFLLGIIANNRTGKPKKQ